MSSNRPARSGEPAPRPRTPRAGRLDCGMLIWIRCGDEAAPTFFEVRRQGRTPGDKCIASYSLAEAGDCGRHIAARTRAGLICTCHEFQLWRKPAAPEGCKHVRALVSFGLL